MTDRNDRIREIAYFLWLDEGCPDGEAERHWSMAEAMVDSEPLERKRLEGEPPGEPLSESPTKPRAPRPVNMAARQSPRRLAVWGSATCCRGSRFPTNSAAKSSETGGMADFRSAYLFRDRGSRLKPSGAPNRTGPDVTAGAIIRTSIASSDSGTKRQAACGFRPWRFHIAPG